MLLSLIIIWLGSHSAFHLSWHIRCASVHISGLRTLPCFSSPRTSPIFCLSCFISIVYILHWGLIRCTIFFSWALLYFQFCASLLPCMLQVSLSFSKYLKENGISHLGKLAYGYGSVDLWFQIRIYAIIVNKLTICASQSVSEKL